MYKKFARYCNYLGNVLCVYHGFHIGLLLLSGQHWYGPIIVGHVIKTAIYIVGEELILGKDQDTVAIAVLHAMLIWAVTVFFLNM
ncbi:hypothetical protein [Acidithiobacillus ferrooxidans]|uniref:hypothetical protein n=1 Tax=Acidithiobacillus ferrooxidans TaxID=920 RepID=UPI0013D6813A|nr:hypothetical protein [Acidithiobacillus ferrooxidans]